VRRFRCRSCLAVGTLLLLVLPAGASAQRARWLSLATARRAVRTYERGYWEGQGVSLRIVSCDRQNAVQVTCTAEALAGEDTRISATDSVTLLPQDIIRVHPGLVEEVLVLKG
jgi:hypothetical protein